MNDGVEPVQADPNKCPNRHVHMEEVDFCKTFYFFLLPLQYRPFHKTLPKSRAFINRTSVRFYETDCIVNVFFLWCISVEGILY